MVDFWTEAEKGKFRAALEPLELSTGRLSMKYNQVIARYRGGQVSEKEQILPIKGFAAFISDAIEKSAFVQLRAGRGDATGMKSFARSMRGFLTHYAGALADHSIAPTTIFSDLLRERRRRS